MRNPLGIVVRDPETLEPLKQGEEGEPQRDEWTGKLEGHQSDLEA